MGSIKQNYANNVLTDGKFDATDLDGVIPNTNINDNSIDNVTVFGTAGSGIASVASDPPSPTVGDVWYNTTTNAFKYAGVGVGSWATGGNLNLARGGMATSQQGTPTASIIAGGADSTAETIYGNTESYDGTNWTEVNDLNVARRGIVGTGTQTASLAISGVNDPTWYTNVESWDGTNWTEITDVNTARAYMYSVGSQTAGLIAGGYIPPSFATTGATESWNGSAWTEVSDLNTNRIGIGGAGTNTSALVSGGSPTNYVESWNGTSWTEVAELNTARAENTNLGATQTAALTFGGTAAGPTIVTNTEEFDGTSWSELNDLSNARRYSGGSGTSSSALAIGGATGGTATEEWTISPFSAKTVTTA